jgi:hypothetical protein
MGSRNERERIYRADGRCVCMCGVEYRDHPIAHVRNWAGSAEYEFDGHQLCNGDVIKT